MGTYSEDDARRIFARAAERQGAGDAPADGLSLAELQAIGEASGIAPEHVAAAAAELRGGAATATRRGGFLGLPALVRTTRALPVALSDDAWERVVGDLRATFRQTGVATDLGRTREWTAGQFSGRDGVRFSARPLPDGRTELVAEHSLEANARALRVVTAAFGALVAVLTVLGVLADAPGSWLLGPLMALALSLAVAVPVWLLRRQARHAERAFGPLLDRAELAARDPAEAPPARHAEATPGERRVDLPDGEPPPAAPSPHRPRRPTR